MWLSRDSAEKKDAKNQMIAVAIDKDKGSQAALKWAIDNILQRGQTVILLHVKLKTQDRSLDQQSKESLFLPFRCFCTRKDIHCRDIMLEDTELPKAIIEFITSSSIEVLVMGSSSKGSFLTRFNKIDTSAIISKGAPDFCSVYVISKGGKISSMKSASRAAPTSSFLRSQITNQQQQQPSSIPNSPLLNKYPTSAPTSPVQNKKGLERTTPSESPFGGLDDIKGFQSPFTRRHPHVKSYGELLDTDISFVSSGRPSCDRMMPPLYDISDPGRSSTSSTDYFYDNFSYGPRRSVDTGASPPPSYFSNASSDDNPSINWSNVDSHAMDDVEVEMRRLKVELKQTMDMYNNAFKEAMTAKQKALELQRWKQEEERRAGEGKSTDEETRTQLEREKAKTQVAMNAAEAQNRVAELEAQKRISTEMKTIKETDERRKGMNSSNSDASVRYRRYTIEEIEIATEYFSASRKIGEGGYGPVYKCNLDHTSVAVKVLRPDAAQGRSQFQQEIEVLSCIRHPNMVLLLGACPEYGCLVYEFMHNGSLEDRLYCRGGTPPLGWQHRFRISAEIATALLFLHQTKPEPLVHRDLKPANILLDRNLVSKISDVGLARLVPPTVANDVTQYRMTATAGTFCYIDPEYQQTGMLGVKSDVYSLGVMLLQIITGKAPMGLTHYVEKAIEEGTLNEMLDPNVPDWPTEAALSYAKMALGCAELRRKDRPDLGTAVLPELCKLRNLADDSLDAMMFGGRAAFNTSYNPNSQSQVSLHNGMYSGPPSHESVRSFH